MGHITHTEKTVFNQLLCVDVLRGKHSTGVALVSSGGDVDVFKKAVNVQDFFDFSTYQTLMKSSYNCMLGHNRYATKGAINNVNAHPFEFDNIVGMHNGTLKTYWQLDNSKDFTVDSECLYSHINGNNIQSAIDKVDGAYALTWFDKRTNQLHFLRNKERPLCYCFSKDGGALFWASEPWMLYGILDRNGVEYNTIFEVIEDTLYTFDVPKQHQTVGLKIAPPKVCKVIKTPVVKKSNMSLVTSTGGTPATYQSYINKEVEFCVNDGVLDNHNSYYVEAFIFNDTAKDIRIYTPKGSTLAIELLENRDLGNFKGKVRRVTVLGNTTYLLLDLRSIEYLGGLWEDVTKDDALKEVAETVSGFQGAQLNMAEFKDASCLGCAWCGDPAFFGDKLNWVEPKEFICESCIAFPEVVDWVGESFGGVLS